MSKSFPGGAGWAAIALVICFALVSIEAGPTSSGTEKPVNEGLKMSRHEMCSYLQQETPLDAEGIENLYKLALDHLAKASSYVTLMRPYVDQKVIQEFDLNGGDLVIAISDALRRFLGEYAVATKHGAGEEQMRKLFERYFYQACEFKMNTLMAEKLMLDSARKTERTAHVQLLPGEQ